MKTLFTFCRFALLPAAVLLTVSCKNKDDDANPYASDPYYGPSDGGSAYGGSGDYPDVQPTAPPAPSYDSGGYTAPPPAPAYSGGGSSTSSGGGTHTVVSGDTLFSLARRYGTSVSAIKSANGLSSDLIRVGQTLTIP